MDVRGSQENRQNAEVEQGLTKLFGGGSKSSAKDWELIDVDGDHTTSVGSPVKTERRIGQGGKSRGGSVVVSVSQLDTVDPRAENIGGNASSINKGRDEGKLVVVNRVVSTQREAQVREQAEDVGQATKVNKPVGSVISVGVARRTQNQSHIPLDGFLVTHGNEQVDVQIVDGVDRQVSSVGVRVDGVAKVSSQTTSNKGVSAELPVLASSGSRTRGTTKEALAAGSAPTALRLSSADFTVSFSSTLIIANAGSQNEGLATVDSQNVEFRAERVGTNRDLTNASITFDLHGQSSKSRSVDVLEDDTVGTEGFPSERDDGSDASGLNVNTSTLGSGRFVPSSRSSNGKEVRTTIRVGGIVGDEQVVGVERLRGLDLSEVDQDAVFSVPSVPEGEEVRIGDSTNGASLEDPRVKRELVAVLNIEAREGSRASAIGTNITGIALATVGTAGTVTGARVRALSASVASGSSLTSLSGKDFSQAARTVVVDVGGNSDVTRSANVEDAIGVCFGELRLVDGRSASGFSLRLKDVAKSFGQVIARIEVTRRNLTRSRQRSNIVHKQELIPSDTLVLVSAKAANAKSLASESVVDVDVGVSTTTAQTKNISVEVAGCRNFNEDLVALNVVTSTTSTNTSTNRESSEGSIVELLDEEVTLNVDVEDIIEGTDSEGVVDGSTANLGLATFTQIPSTNRGVVSSDDKVVAARSQLPLTNNVRRIKAYGALTRNVDGNVRITSRRASTVDITSVLNNPDGVVGERSDVVVVGDLTSITNRGSADTFNKGEVNNQTGGVVQIYGSGDEGSESLDISNRTSQIPNSEVVNNTVELLSALTATQTTVVLASADENLLTSVSGQSTGSGSIDNDSSVSVGSN